MLQYRVQGRARRMKIGTYPSISLKAARSKAWKLISQVENGEDPQRVRQAKRDRKHSFESLAREALASRAKRTRKKTQKERERILEAELLPSWRARPASEITRRDVVELTEAIAQRGAPAMANRTLDLIRLIFNEGLRRGFPTIQSNPAHMVEKPGRENPRHRYLDQGEIRAIWRALEAEDLSSRALIRLALLTAQRMGSLSSMRWDDLEIDGETALWTIPKENFKGKRIQLVPLSAGALEIIETLREHAFSAEYVFPSRSDARLPYRTNWKGVVRRLRKATEIEDWTAHDFRTTFRTWAVRAEGDGGLGVPNYVADAVLGHSETSLGFRHYTGDQARYLLHEKREALSSWGSFIEEATDGE